ncbi:MAG: membrane-bound PQQ-dependent dehydrogenase, glucose/quinate/shikimate family, partial [Hyphomicrobiaceae bacterium]
MAVVLALTGLWLFCGGLYLIYLGGSWYYVIAGAGLVASAWRIWQGSFDGLYIFLVVFIFTFAWTLFETGLNFWGWVPRMAAPLVLAVALFLS